MTRLFSLLIVLSLLSSCSSEKSQLVPKVQSQIPSSKMVHNHPVTVKKYHRHSEPLPANQTTHGHRQAEDTSDRNLHGHPGNQVKTNVHGHDGEAAQAIVEHD